MEETNEEKSVTYDPGRYDPHDVLLRRSLRGDGKDGTFGSDRTDHRPLKRCRKMGLGCRHQNPDFKRY